MIEKFGAQTQLCMLAEEQGELIKAINKRLRNKTLDNKDIIEEMADVMIVMQQFVDFFNIDSNRINSMAKEKIKRTEERIKKGIL